MTRLAFAALAAALSAPAASAQVTLPAAPPHFTFELLVSGVTNMTDFVPLANGGLLLARQSGHVQLASPEGALHGTVLDISADVSGDFDRGLVAIALHPGFVADGGPKSWLYAYYSAGPDQPNGQDGHPILGALARHRIHTVVLAGIPVLRAVPGSKQLLLGERLPDGTAPTAIPLLHESHLGGALVFGADGTLLLSTGDGASFVGEDFGGEQPWGFDDFVHPVTGLKGPWPKSHDQGRFRAQDLDTLSGKVLRLDPETGFGVPSNPFFDGDPTSRRSRVWARGLRNPFRMAPVPGTGASDPALGQPGWVWIGDVGHTGWEEVDLVRGGDNFGWPCFEGHKPFVPGQAHQPPPNPYGWLDCASITLPVSSPALSIHHAQPQSLQPAGVYQDLAGQSLGGFVGFCIVGGAVYSGDRYPAAYAGRYVFGDFGNGWAKALALDAAGAVDSVVDLAAGLHRVVATRPEPATGDLLFGIGGHVGQPSQVYALRYGANALPVLSVQHAIAPGGDLLAIAFDASATTDADGDVLAFTWDFGDGASAQGALVTHTFGAGVPHVVRVTANDGFGDVSLDVPVLPGLVGPAVALLSPPQGLVLEPGEPLFLSAAAADALGASLELAWSIDVFVDGAWLLDHIAFSGAASVLPFGPAPTEQADWGWRVRVRALDGGVTVAEETVHVHPAPRVSDVAGAGVPLAKVLALSPPGSQGFGSKDVEVWRDRELPVPGAAAAKQYATYHPLSAGASEPDWIGYALPADVPTGTRVFGVELTEGLHVPDGGWFEQAPVVEVRLGGTWQAAADVQCDPPYPLAGAGDDFATYRFTFAPIAADAVRLTGTPGGSERFVSVAELRVLAVGPPGPWRDVTMDASAALADTLELAPSGPQGFGSLDFERLRDGAAPAPDSTSVLAQVTSYHPAGDGEQAWFGWRFDDATTFTAARFTEGLSWTAAGMPIGGWLEQLVVETRLDADAPWVAVQGLDVTPPYRTVGPASPDYQTYALDFEPRIGRELRVVGPPGGLFAFASAAELRVFAPHGFGASWAARAGLGLAGDVLALVSTTPPVPGLPILVEASGAAAHAPGALAIAAEAATLPLGGVTVLFAPASAVLLPVAFDAEGRLAIAVDLPADPALAGATVTLQVAALAPAGLQASNALDAVVGGP